MISSASTNQLIFKLPVLTRMANANIQMAFLKACVIFLATFGDKLGTLACNKFLFNLLATLLGRRNFFKISE